MPRAFDLRFVAYFRGIQAYGKAISPAHIIIAGRPSLRGRITQGIFEALPPTVAGVAAAFVTGDRVGISPQDVKALRGSGLAHLLAISGLHISLVMASVYMLVTLVTIVFLRNYSTRIPLKIIASIAALSVGFVYLFIANFSLPTLRAFLMASILVVGVLTDRRVVTLRSVALSASLILLIMPESLFSISFQLSFAAVSVLVFLYYHSRFQGTGVIATVKNLSITSLAVFLATIPFTAHYFGTIAVYSVVANIIAIPLMTFLVMPLLFCGVIVYLLVHSTMVLSLSGVALSLLLSLAHFVYALPHSVITVSRLPVASLLFFILSGYLWLTSGQSGRLIISALLSIAMIIAILPKDIAAAYVDNAGVVAIKYNDSYLINARRNSYFAKWVHLETGLAVKRAKICKKRVCYVDAIAYVYGTKMPAYLCDKHWKDRQGKNKRVKLIVAPRASIKNCGVPSIDALDIYLNGSYIIKTATRVTHASSGTGSFLGIFPSMARWWYHARTPHRL